jgi:hypothetical protein
MVFLALKRPEDFNRQCIQKQILVASGEYGNRVEL